jgi:hypothetical protein
LINDTLAVFAAGYELHKSGQQSFFACANAIHPRSASAANDAAEETAKA